MSGPSLRGRSARPVLLAVLLGLVLAVVAIPMVSGVPAGATRAQEPEPDPRAQLPAEGDSPGQIRDETRQILEGREFSYEKGYFERFVEWLGRQLGGRSGPSGPGTEVGAFGGGIGTVVAWVILAIAAAALAFVGYRYFKRRTPKVTKEREAPITAVERGRSAREWNSDAERFEAAGEWKQAMRARYRLLVRELIDRGLLPDIVGRTTRELRVEIEKSAPAAADNFDAASTLFELPWYGAEETGPDENQRFRNLATEILETTR
ncbi:MAG: DUF4129 domain-containing protein [Microthrixaceae bacterium]